MTPPIFLAHGALGYWDELIFLGVAVAFVVMMGVSWVRSRAIEPEFEDDEQPNTLSQSATDPVVNASAPDRFKLD